MENILTNKKLYYNFILAMCKNKGIGYKGRLPWDLPGEMQYFKRITSSVFDEEFNSSKFIPQHFMNNFTNFARKPQINTRKNIVVMGRTTWDSIPEKFRPLSGRINVVLSKSEKFREQHPQLEGKFYSVSDIEKFFKLAEEFEKKEQLNEIFIIGGNKIYEEFLSKFPEQCKIIFQTYIEHNYPCDVFFEVPKNFKPIFVSKTQVENAKNDQDNGVAYDYRILINENILKEKENFNNIIKANYLEMNPSHEELQYLDALRDILQTGKERTDRTGVGTISKFGLTMRFDCSESFPLLTTKDTFWRGIVEELLWFLRGDTNAKHLQEKKVHIWDGNASRQFLDSLGLNHREEGDLGPVYGFQWRHFGAKYNTMHDDYNNQGVDQIQDVISQIKSNPQSRRIILSAWNPSDLKLMALPPCHVMSQFYVTGDKLNLQMYQRSGDMGLGVPFNIASYALLLRIIAQMTGYKPGEFIHVLGDAHIYKSHVEAIKVQLTRTPNPFPILQINPKCQKIEDFTFNDFKLINYNHHPKIKMDMAV